MKRDMDLVRTIMLKMEESGDVFSIPNCNRECLQYHCHIMKQAGLIDAADVTPYASNLPQAVPVSLTWQGHEFIDAAKNETIWQQAKKSIEEKVGQVALPVLLAYLQSLARKHLGI